MLLDLPAVLPSLLPAFPGRRHRFCVPVRAQPRCHHGITPDDYAACSGGAPRNVSHAALRAGLSPACPRSLPFADKLIVFLALSRNRPLSSCFWTPQQVNQGFTSTHYPSSLGVALQDQGSRLNLKMLNQLKLLCDLNLDAPRYKNLALCVR